MYQHKSGLILPFPEKKPPIAIDFFCGCGGFSLGIMQAGFQVVAAVDFDAEASIAYLSNLGSYPLNLHFIEESDEERFEKALQKLHKGNKDKPIPATISGGNFSNLALGVPPVSHFWFGDIRKLKGADMLYWLDLEQGDVDLVVGGPPCQGFSAAGKREVMDPRNSLVFEYARLILEIMPKTMVMENVPGILSMVTPEGIPVVDAFCKILAEGGFGGYEALKKTLLATSDAGAAMKGQKKYSKKRASEKTKEPEKPKGKPIIQESLF